MSISSPFVCTDIMDMNRLNMDMDRLDETLLGDLPDTINCVYTAS